MSTKVYIAHPGDEQRKDQTLEEHLRGVAELSRGFAAKIGLEEAGELLGLLHDLGKYSSRFQSYIRSADGRLDPDAVGYLDPRQHKGKIDHSTAGAQYAWKILYGQGELQRLTGQILALCIASHHSGLIDCVAPDDTLNKEAKFERRIKKTSDQTFFDEVCENADTSLLTRINELLDTPSLVDGVKTHLAGICLKNHRPGVTNHFTDTIPAFQAGFFVRFLFSCLVDADRIDTADYEQISGAKLRQHGAYRSWESLVKRLESHLSSFSESSTINRVRCEVSEACRQKAEASQGIYSLTVPTGGGKTLASLRFALNHASIHSLDRIIYVVPYTSIIDQNAEVARRILENPAVDSFGSVVLEHHSNLTPDEQSWQSKILSEDWDAPIVFTTSVQLLEVLFGGGTRGVRRLHQVARSVLVFDEIQTLPIRCIRLFCNALNYLVDNCQTTALLCTATQPLLSDLEDDNNKGRLRPPKEIISDVENLYSQLKRVEVVNKCKTEGWNTREIAQLAIDETAENRSVLLIVNTKKAAREIYNELKELDATNIFHLSTSMCPQHRMDVFGRVRDRLGTIPMITVSTQLIEAGVDIDFDTVIRFLAGMDSIAQAAGRCNRNGRRPRGRTILVNPAEENLSSLPDIKKGKDVTLRILNEFREDPASLGEDLLHPLVTRRYFQYYFFERQDEMDYSVPASKLGRDDTLLRLLSTNNKAARRLSFAPAFAQAFSSAGKTFQVIDAPTQGVIVPYGTRGRELIAKLSAAFELEKQSQLLKQAQRFSVNVFSHEIASLSAKAAISPAQEGSEVLCLDERYYSEEFGISLETVNGLDVQII